MWVCVDEVECGRGVAGSLHAWRLCLLYKLWLRSQMEWALPLVIISAPAWDLPTLGLYYSRLSVV